MRPKRTAGDENQYFEQDERTQITGFADLSPELGAAPQALPPQPLPPRLSSPDPKLEALRSLSLPKDGPSTQVAVAAGPRSAKLPWILLAVVVVAFGGYVVIVPMLNRSASPQVGTTSGAASIETVQATASGGQALHAAGYMAARTPIVVGSVTPGRIKTLLVTEGDLVKKNQILAQLDDGQARAELSLASARMRDAERQLSRTKMLRNVEGATASDLDRAIGQVDIARAALAPIQQQIDDAKIRSPIDGTILEELVHPGAIIVGNAGVFRLADLTRLAAEIDVNEADLALVRVDQKVNITSDAFADRTFPGTVHEIGEQVDRAKGTVVIKVYLEVAENTLRPGMSVKAVFEAAETKPRILIPRSAVDAAGSVSVVGTDGQRVAKHVSVQNVGPDRVEVIDGLTIGDRIVVPASHP